MTPQIKDQYPQWTQRIAERWEELCKIWVIRYPDIAALLCNASPVAVIGKEGEFVLFVQVAYASHLDKLSASITYQVVEEVLQRMYDQVTVFVRFIGKPSEPEDLETGTAPLTQLTRLPPQEAPISLQDILDQWGSIQRACKLKSPKASTLLSEATPKAVTHLGTRELILEVASEVTREKLSKSPHRATVEWAVGAVVGIPYRIHLLQPGEPLPIQYVQAVSDLQGVISGWEHIQKACRRKSPKVAALLQSTEPVALIGADGRELVLRVEYDFHHKKLSEPELHQIIEQAVNEVVGTSYRVHLIRKDDPIPTA